MHGRTSWCAVVVTGRPRGPGRGAASHLETLGVGVGLAADQRAQALGPVAEAVGVAVELVAGAGGHGPLMGGERLVGLVHPVAGHAGQRRDRVLHAPPEVEWPAGPAPGRTRSG